MPTTNYIWDVETDSYLMETDGSNVTQAVYTNEPVQFGNLVSQRRGSTTNYCHFDALGSTRQLTDATQTVTDTFTYDAWGSEMARTGSTTMPFTWVGDVGYYHDTENDQFYVRRRIYLRSAGRWQSVDPVEDMDGPNAYAYVYNTPLTLLDPYGLAPEDPCKCCKEERTKNYPSVTVSGTDKLGKKRICKVLFVCNEKGCGEGGGHYGQTPYPTPSTNEEEKRLNIYYIRVCVSCKAPGQAIPTIFVHELEHAKRFCEGKVIRDCDTCKEEEGAAYAVSCKFAFPMDEKKRKRCEDCGVRLGCSDRKAADGKTPCTVEGDCKITDLFPPGQTPPGKSKQVSFGLTHRL